MHSFELQHIDAVVTATVGSLSQSRKQGANLTYAFHKSLTVLDTSIVESLLHVAEQINIGNIQELCGLLLTPLTRDVAPPDVAPGC